MKNITLVVIMVLGIVRLAVAGNYQYTQEEEIQKWCDGMSHQTVGLAWSLEHYPKAAVAANIQEEPSPLLRELNGTLMSAILNQHPNPYQLQDLGLKVCLQVAPKYAKELHEMVNPSKKTIKKHQQEEAAHLTKQREELDRQRWEGYDPRPVQPTAEELQKQKEEKEKALVELADQQEKERQEKEVAKKKDFYLHNCHAKHNPQNIIQWCKDNAQYAN